jgi:hypothetical protein
MLSHQSTSWPPGTFGVRRGGPGPRSRRGCCGRFLRGTCLDANAPEGCGQRTCCVLDVVRPGACRRCPVREAESPLLQRRTGASSSHRHARAQRPPAHRNCSTLRARRASDRGASRWVWSRNSSTAPERQRPASRWPATGDVRQRAGDAAILPAGSCCFRQATNDQRPPTNHQSWQCISGDRCPDCRLTDSAECRGA